MKYRMIDWPLPNILSNCPDWESILQVIKFYFKEAIIFQENNCWFFRTNKLNHSSAEIADLFALLSLLYFNNEVSAKETDKLQQLVEILNFNNVNLTNLLRAISPSCKDILVKCKWKEEERRCDTIFEKIITSEGHCCAFNYFAPKGHIFKG